VSGCQGVSSGHSRTQRVAKAKGFRLFGREDEGYFRCAFAVLAAHRDLGTAARVHPNLVLRHGFGGAAVGAAKGLFLREPRCAPLLFARE
jgi:hypothetical protein